MHSLPRISQIVPANFSVHMQIGFAGSSLREQVPPLRQGLGSQGETEKLQ